MRRLFLMLFVLFFSISAYGEEVVRYSSVFSNEAELSRYLNNDGKLSVLVRYGFPDNLDFEEMQILDRGDILYSNMMDQVSASVLKSIGLDEVKSVHRYQNLPLMLLEVSLEELELLKSNENVLYIDVNELFEVPDVIEQDASVFENEPMLNNGVLERIGVNSYYDLGYRGNGVYVAVLDTGILKSHNNFLGKEIYEACFSLANTCPNGSNEMFGDGSAVMYPSNYGGFDHGTHVSGIAAGNIGVSRDSDIIAINVFSIVNGRLSAYTSDILKGLDYVYSLSHELNVGSVNLSLGSGRAYGYCDTHILRESIHTLVNNGVMVAVAVGNSGFCNSISAPSCISSAIAVGSVDNDDNPSSFTNWHWHVMDMYAPGENIYSSRGYHDYSYGSMSGTSMSTPFVSGSLALIKERYPEIGMADLYMLLRENGPDIVAACDPRHTSKRLFLGSNDVCSYSINVSDVRLSSNSGNGSFQIRPNRSDCSWSITNNVSWLSLDRTNGSGQTTINYTYTSNDSSTERSGIVNVSGVNINFVQEGVNVDERTLGEHLNNSDLVWSTSGHGEWFGDYTTSVAGGSSLRSGQIGHSSYSDLITNVNSGGVIHFHWKVSSERMYDRLQFIVNDRIVSQISGEIDWQEIAFSIPDGNNTLKWRYIKDGSLSRGSDTGWLDNVIWRPSNAVVCEYTLSESSINVNSNSHTGSLTLNANHSGCEWVFTHNSSWFSISPLSGVGTTTLNYTIDENTNSDSRTLTLTIGGVNLVIVQDGVENPGGSLGDHLDNTELEWATSGHNTWIPDMTTSVVGGSSLRSGVISHSRRSDLTTQVNESGVIRFNWKVSSEQRYDRLQFIVNGRIIAQISGNVNWTEYSYELTESSNSLMWRYMKDGSISLGADAGWLDNVRFEPRQIDCDISLSVNSINVNSNSHTGSLVINSSHSHCEWSFNNNSSWFSISPLSGVGTTTLNYSIGENTNSDSRNVSISIGDNVLNVEQEGFVSPDGSLGDYLDNTELEWNTSGHNEWSGDYTTSVVGGSSLKSGRINHRQSSIVETVVGAEYNVIRFHWKVSSERMYDTLDFFVNNQRYARISGEVNWTELMFHLPENRDNVLRWVYRKDPSLSRGADAGWLDNVRVE